MSHTTVIRDVNYASANCLELTLQEFCTKFLEKYPQIKFLKNSRGNVGTKRGGQQGVNSKDATTTQFDYVLQFFDKENYAMRDIGFLLTDGQYQVHTDDYSSGRIKSNSHEFCEFSQLYSKNAIVQTAIAAGHMVESVDLDSSGNYQITIKTGV